MKASARVPVDAIERMCSRKLRYGKHEAKRYARSRRQRAYECPQCRWWHLTSIDHDGPRG